MNKTDLKKIHLQVTELLADALQEAEVNYQDSMVKIVIQRATFELNFGPFLWRIQQLIDERYPERASDISILIRDAGGRFEHVFKIWKS